MSTNSKLYYCQVWSSPVYSPPPLLPIKLCEMSGQRPPYKINRFSMILLKEKQILLTHKWRTFCTMSYLTAEWWGIYCYFVWIWDMMLCVCVCVRERERDFRLLLQCIEIFTFLGCYVASVGSWLPKFQDCFTLVNGTDTLSQKPVTGCQSVAHNNPSRV